MYHFPIVITQRAIKGTEGIYMHSAQVWKTGRGSAGRNAQHNAVIMKTLQALHGFTGNLSGSRINQRAVNVEKMILISFISYLFLNFIP